MLGDHKLPPYKDNTDNTDTHSRHQHHNYGGDYANPQHHNLITTEGYVSVLANTTVGVYNVSGGGMEQDERGVGDWMEDLGLGGILAFLCLVTVVGNAMVLHAVRTERSLQTVSNMYIVSLAIADLTVGLVVMPISALYIFSESWHYGLVLCQLWIGLDYTASTASIFNLFILSLDRYWSVTSPLKYLHQRTKRRALIMISSAWFISSLWIIPILGWHHFASGGVRTVPLNECDTEYATNTSLKIITGIINYYLPLTVMYILYGKIFNEIRKRSKLEIGQKNTARSLRKDVSVSENSDSPHYAVYSSAKNSVSVRANHDANETEEELLKLHPSVEVYTSDSERNHYIYDETVVDATTETLQRFFYEEKQSMSNNNHDRTAETSLCSFPNSPVLNNHQQYKAKDRVRLNVPMNGSPPKTPHIFPKEFHPAKNQYISKPVRSTNSLLQVPKPPRPERSLSTKSRRGRGRSFRRGGPSSALSKEIKAARQLGVIMGAFTVCFFPYFVCFLVVAFCDGCITPELMTAMTWIGYLNSTLNPVLYPLCNLHFRRKFRKMLRFRTDQKKSDYYGQTRLTLQHNNHSYTVE